MRPATKAQPSGSPTQADANIADLSKARETLEKLRECTSDNPNFVTALAAAEKFLGIAQEMQRHLQNVEEDPSRNEEIIKALKRMDSFTDATQAAILLLNQAVRTLKEPQKSAESTE